MSCTLPDGGFTTSLDIYLDPDAGWANDLRFDFSSAVSTPAGDHLRDFVFNAGFYNDAGGPGDGINRFVVSTSPNAGRGNSYPKNPDRNPIAITTAGWYTFEHVFADNGAGVLAVTLKIKDSLGAEVATWTLSNSTDVIGTTVGGNRYGWVANIEFPGGLAIDRSGITSSREPNIANITQSTYHFAISSAQGEAADGNTIRLASGVYSEGSLNLSKPLTIEGPNAGTTGNAIDRDDEARISNSAWTITAPGVVLDGLEIYQTDNAASPVSVQASNTTVRNSIIRREGVDANQPVRGIEISPGLTGYSISGNLFTGDGSGGFFSGHKTWNSGIYLNGGSGGITGNTFENCRTAINADDFNAGIAISGNTFRNSGSYLAFGGTTQTNGQFTIAGNEFFIDWLAPGLPSTLFNNSNVAAEFRIDATGNTFGGVATTALSPNQKFQIESRMFHRGRSTRNGVVDFVANQQVVAGSSATYTIAGAITAASSGGSVLIGSGPYSAEINLTKQLSILGANAGIAAGVNLGTRGAETIINGGFIVSVAGATIDGLTIQNGCVSGSHKVGVAVAANDVTITNTIIENVLAPDQSDGLSTQPGNNGLTLSNSTIRNNWRGIYLNPGDGHLFTGNLIDANNGVGVGIGSDGQSNLTLTNNVVSNHTLEGWGASAVGSGVVAQENNFVANGVSVAHYGGSPIDATKCYWGAANPDFGTTVAGTVSTSPWYADEARTILVTAENFQDTTIPAGSSVTETDLYIGAFATYTVEGSLIVNGDLTLADGATLEVVNGSLTINGSTLSGSFTFFNSLGSINFNDDVTITGSAEGLILISDVHVADGATITVDGTLVIDGSVVDCQDPSGSFTLQINDGATFTMARTVFVNGDMVVESGDTAIYDNRFEGSTIAVDAGASAARVFHNLTDDLGWLTGTAVTSVDGWANVTDAADTENNLALGLDISGLPADRTQDVDGSVFIQPNDLVASSLDVSALQTEISAVEVMLGYNTGLLATTGLVADPDWDAVLDSNFDSSSMIGLIDSALGYTLTLLDPSEGSSANQTIATVALTAGTTEGETLFFHRVKLASDEFGGETRLTTGGASPAFLTPFTSNSAMITIDGTEPLIADPAANATIEQLAADVNTDTTPTAVTIQGDVDITASAFDALAGIEDAKAVVALVGPTTYTATQTGTSAGPNIGGDDYTTYSFTYTVDETTLNGTYDVVFTVTDRSGNQTVETLGSILINKNQVVVNIELEGLAAGPLTRDVVLVFTDIGGSVIETRTEAVEFTGGVGSVTLADVDGASFRLSAKAAWNLRNRLDIGLDGNGQALVEFTGAEELRGGDLNGDNVINTLDYSILRFNWFTTNAVADITGDGAVNVTDFNILQGNFYQAGDPQ